MDIGLLNDLRKGKGIKQKVMAKSIRMSIPYLSLVEKVHKVPSIEMAEKMCEYLYCELIILPKR